MRIYWAWKSIPELAGLSKDERRRVLKATGQKQFRHWQVWAAFLAAWLVLYLLADMALPALGDLIPFKVVRVAVSLVAMGLVVVFLRQVMVHFMRPHIREQLQREQSQVQGDT